MLGSVAFCEGTVKVLLGSVGFCEGTAKVLLGSVQGSVGFCSRFCWVLFEVLLGSVQGSVGFYEIPGRTLRDLTSPTLPCLQRVYRN